MSVILEEINKENYEIQDPIRMAQHQMIIFDVDSKEKGFDWLMDNFSSYYIYKVNADKLIPEKKESKFIIDYESVLNSYIENESRSSKYIKFIHEFIELAFDKKKISTPNVLKVNFAFSEPIVSASSLYARTVYDACLSKTSEVKIHKCMFANIMVNLHWLRVQLMTLNNQSDFNLIKNVRFRVVNYHDRIWARFQELGNQDLDIKYKYFIVNVLYDKLKRDFSIVNNEYFYSKYDAISKSEEDINWLSKYLPCLGQ